MCNFPPFLQLNRIRFCWSAVVAGWWGRGFRKGSCFESDSSALETPTQYVVVFLMEQMSVELLKTAPWTHVQSSEIAMGKQLKVCKVEEWSAAGTCFQITSVFCWAFVESIWAGWRVGRLFLIPPSPVSSRDGEGWINEGRRCSGCI